MYKVEITEEQDSVAVDGDEIRRVVAEVLRRHDIPAAELHVLIVDDRAIHEINAAHLQHDFPTDVITFPLNEAGRLPPDYPLEGEIVISAEMAATMSSEAGWSPHEELLLYVVHALLHLCGYNDLTESEQQQMRCREREMLHELGITPSATDSRWEHLP
jgi:probable rRNA maturation factor